MTSTSQEVDQLSIDQQIGEAINQLLFRRRLMKKTAAHAIGLDSAQFSKSLRGDRGWRAEEVVRLADFLGVQYSVLLPHLDSNQEPSAYKNVQVSGLHERHLRLVA